MDITISQTVTWLQSTGVERTATGFFEFFPVYSGPALALYPASQVVILRGSALILSVCPGFPPPCLNLRTQFLSERKVEGEKQLRLKWIG